ncbi:MAG: dihydropteroate synthase, partial [Trueperaceae bacterium]
RPGASPTEVDEERRRVLPVIEALADRGDLRLSVDTRRPEVAREAVAAGAHLVNDVHGLRDPAMRRVCAETGVPAVAMHMQGTPATMQDHPRYDDVVAEVHARLREAAERAEVEGVPSVAVDPGWGFGKRDEDHLALLASLPTLAADGRPVVFGASRKGSIGRWADEPDPSRRDPGTWIVHHEAVRGGAAMLRVHDVAGQVQALRVQRQVHRLPSREDGQDRIVLDGMEFHGYHGAFEEEARFGARFRVDLEMQVPLPREDDLSRTVDYARVYAQVAELVTGPRYRVIEALASAIAERVLAGDVRIARVLVRVHKPHAPLPGVVRDVTVQVSRRR